MTKCDFVLQELSLLISVVTFKGKGLETVQPNQNESSPKTKLFDANSIQIGP